MKVKISIAHSCHSKMKGYNILFIEYTPENINVTMIVIYFFITVLCYYVQNYMLWFSKKKDRKKKNI